VALNMLYVEIHNFLSHIIHFLTVC
jgi:hypothetical protein